MIKFTEFVKSFYPNFITDQSKWKICDEYRVMATLIYSFPDEFKNLVHGDKPDLRLDKSVGIEVTQCLEESYNKSIGVWTKFRTNKSGMTKEKCQQIIKREGGEMHDGMIIHKVSSPESQLVPIKEGINKKILKIGHYKSQFPKCKLAIILEEPLPTVIEKAIQYFNDSQKENKNVYDELFILSNQSLVRFNYLKRTTKITKFNREEVNCITNISVIMANGLENNIKKCFIFD